jgi:hypothetical protein
VSTLGCVEALVGQNQTLDRPAVDNVRFNDLFDVGGRDATIPGAIRIDDHRWAVLALIETPGHVGTHAFLESAQSKFLFEEQLQLGLARGIATTARVSSVALIAADEKMLLELGHEINVQDFVPDKVKRVTSPSAEPWPGRFDRRWPRA